MSILARILLREYGPRICWAPPDDPPPADPPPGDPPPSDPPPSDPAPLEKPAYVPDKIWKPEQFVNDKGELDHAKVGQALSDWGTAAEKKIHTRTDHLRKEIREEIDRETAAKMPASPDAYKLNIPQRVKDAELTIDEKDPLLTWFRQTAHDMKMSQDQFDEKIAEYIDMTLKAQPDAEAVFKEIGEFGRERARRVQSFMKLNLSADGYKHFSSIPVSVGSMAVFEELLGLTGEPDFNMDRGEPGEDLTLDELREMQNDDRYTGAKGQYNPAFVRKVQAGFKRLAERKQRENRQG